MIARRLVATTAGGIVGLTMAARGGGVWSLVGQSLGNGFFGLVVLWSAAQWRPSFRMSKSAARGLMVVADTPGMVCDERLPDAPVPDGVEVRAESLFEDPSLLQTLLVSFAPTLLLVGLFVFGSRYLARKAGGLGGIGGLGRSKAVRADEAPGLRTTFADVAGIDDFSRLPIPFRAVATDLETGEAVVLDRGDLALALRASRVWYRVSTPTNAGKSATHCTSRPPGPPAST